MVTADTNMNYVIGQQIRLLVPETSGTYQLNEQTGLVMDIPNADQVEIDIDSRNYNQFITSSAISQPQIVAIGDINTGFINPYGRNRQGTYIPGSFINISPQ